MAKPLRVLIVEDAPDDAELLLLELRRGGYDPVAERVETPAAMQAALEGGPWDVILSDNSLPQFSAEAALRVLWELGLDIPFIVVSGSIDEDAAVALMKAGAHDYLFKGKLARLGPAVERELREAEERRKRRQADQALRAQQAFLKQVIDADPNLVFVKDWDGKFTLVNKAVADVYGTTVDGLLGKTDADFNRDNVEVEHFLRDDREVMANLRRRLIPEEPVTNPSTGQTRWFQTVKVPLISSDGKARHVLGVATDITERKRMEETAHASQARFAGIVDMAGDAIISVDEHQRIQLFNRGAEKIFGYAAAEVLGQSLDVILPSRFVEVHRQHIQGFVGSADTARRMGERSQIFGRRKDGMEFPAEASISKLQSGSEAVLTVILRDISERKQLEEQFRQAQKMEAVGRLAGGVAHDFNNLLTVITSYSDILLEDLASQDPRREDVEEIRKAAVSAAGLTRQLLAFSRQQVLQPRVLDVNAVLANAEKLLKRLLGEDIELVTTLTAQLGAVKADPGQLEQVIMNLAVNARDAMPDGGKLTIETANAEMDEAYVRTHPVAKPGHYVMLAVSDTGIGMDEQTKSRIFEPFFTTKEAGKGTGLGLATVYGIVKQSGGFIWVYSEPSHGTTFKIYLPRVEETVEGLTSPAAPGESLRGAETVLLAEDAAAVRTVARQVLERLGYTVLEAPNGEAALHVARKHHGPIDLLLTDVVMPELSGRQLADQLKALRPGLKVLYASGYTDDAVVRHGVLEPGIAYLQKPFTPEGLARKVREVLNSPQLPEAARVR